MFNSIIGILLAAECAFAAQPSDIPLAARDIPEISRMVSEARRNLARIEKEQKRKAAINKRKTDLEKRRAQAKERKIRVQVMEATLVNAAAMFSRRHAVKKTISPSPRVK